MKHLKTDDDHTQQKIWAKIKLCIPALKG